MTRGMRIAVTSLLVLISSAAIPLTVLADDTASAGTPNEGGCLRRLHKKIRNMRPRIKLRKAAKNALSGDKQAPAATGK